MHDNFTRLRQRQFLEPGTATFIFLLFNAVEGLIYIQGAVFSIIKY